ncbi:hypothetical protein [Verrucomicrobium sp. BvORR034]|uniref:hypothetical protein n=1 Tax=Verrucomicrobium sp. BvORR034 TaxID=1396418 RepID=UPI0006794F86|nr:hypothetical protein [Verrucomicrobium sp. BvORR034]
MPENSSIQLAENELMRKLEALEPTRRQRVARKLISAALSAIPWIGGFLAARIAYNEESGQLEVNRLNKEWMAEHEKRLQTLGEDLAALTARLETLGDSVADRVESDGYMALVRKAFRVYDQADTAEKRNYVCKLLANAAATSLTEDDIVRLFLDWLDTFHEAHFLVIREIYRRPGSTRYEIWTQVRGPIPREDSAEADLFKLLIRDLSQGGIIRQHRETDYYGNYIKKTRPKKAPGTTASTTMKSAFDDEEAYELTGLGSQFVHYVFTELVQRLDTETQPRQ